MCFAAHSMHRIREYFFVIKLLRQTTKNNIHKIQKIAWGNFENFNMIQAILSDNRILGEIVCCLLSTKNILREFFSLSNKYFSLDFQSCFKFIQLF